MGNFRESLKNYESEEVADLLIFRPIAHIVVKIIYRTSLTPNQISLLSVISCFIAAVLYAYATPWSWLVAACFYFFYCVLDCVDGQIARLKGTGTKTGRIIDGVADYVSHVLLYIGLIIAMVRMQAVYPLPFFPEILIAGWIWVLLTAATVVAHAMLLDHHRNIFMAITKGDTGWEEDEIEEFTKEYARLKKANEKPFDRLIIRAYLGYTGLFLRFQGKNNKSSKRIDKNYNPKEYYNKNLLAVRLWGFIGGSTNILIFAVMSALLLIKEYFWFTVFITNIYMLFVLVYQFRVNAKLRK